MESDHFTVVPSLGALVPLWLLIVTKQHARSFSELPDEYENEFESLVQSVTSLLPAKSKYVLFEHGPSDDGKSVGCSVDHAHCHLVKIDDVELLEISQKLHPSIEWRDSESTFFNTALALKGRDYVIWQGNDGKIKIASSYDFPSQLMRQAIAHKLNLSTDEFDWHVYPRHESAIAMKAVLTGESAIGQRPE